MKQLCLDLMKDEDTKLSILLEQKAVDELVRLMGKAVIKVYKQGGRNDKYISE